MNWRGQLPTGGGGNPFDQNLNKADTPSFRGLTLTGSTDPLTVFGPCDFKNNVHCEAKLAVNALSTLANTNVQGTLSLNSGINQYVFPTSRGTPGEVLKYTGGLNTAWAQPFDQSLNTTDSPQFANLTVNGFLHVAEFIDTVAPGPLVIGNVNATQISYGSGPGIAQDFNGDVTMENTLTVGQSTTLATAASPYVMPLTAGAPGQVLMMPSSGNQTLFNSLPDPSNFNLPYFGNNITAPNFMNSLPFVPNQASFTAAASWQLDYGCQITTVTVATPNISSLQTWRLHYSDLSGPQTFDFQFPDDFRKDLRSANIFAVGNSPIGIQYLSTTGPDPGAGTAMQLWGQFH